MFQKPIWLTEFAGSGSSDEQQGFFKQVLPWMEQQPWIERYAGLCVYFPLLNARNVGFGVGHCAIMQDWRVEHAGGADFCVSRILPLQRRLCRHVRQRRRFAHAARSGVQRHGLDGRIACTFCNPVCRSSNPCLASVPFLSVRLCPLRATGAYTGRLFSPHAALQEASALHSLSAACMSAIQRAKAAEERPDSTPARLLPGYLCSTVCRGTFEPKP